LLDPDDAVDPELRALYALERAAPLPDGATTRVLTGVLGAITKGGVAVAGASTATTSTAGVAASKVVAIAVASAIGGGVVAVVGDRELALRPVLQQPAPPRETLPRPEGAVPTIDASAALDAPSAPPVPVTVAPVPAGTRRATPDAASEATADDSREPLVIDRARTALRRGLVDEALETLMRHERLYPTGALAEERDVLIIEAYLAKGAASTARRRIERYQRDYPDGFLRARVDAAYDALDAP
jgi:hypothetical protein